MAKPEKLHFFLLNNFDVHVTGNDNAQPTTNGFGHRGRGGGRGGGYRGNFNNRRGGGDRGGPRRGGRGGFGQHRGGGGFQDHVSLTVIV